MKVDSLFKQDRKTVERVTKIVTDVWTCSVCHADLPGCRDAREHYRMVHMQPPDEWSVGDGTLYFFTDEAQSEFYVGSADLEWTGPGWYGESIDPNKDEDYEEVVTWRHVDALRQERLQRISDDANVLAAFEKAKASKGL